MKLPTITHKVKKGEHLTGIANKYGFPGSAWKSIYNAKYNAAFNGKHKDPNVILPGSEFKIPIITKAKLSSVYSAVSDVIGVFEAVLRSPDEIDRGIEKLRTEVKKGRAAEARPVVPLAVVVQAQKAVKAQRKLVDKSIDAVSYVAAHLSGAAAETF